MSTELKALLKQFGEDYRGEQQTNLLAEVGQLQKGGMSFEEAWQSAKAAHPEPAGEEVPKFVYVQVTGIKEPGRTL